VHWKGTLNAYLERDLANSEGFTNSVAAAGGDNSLEDLDTAAVTLNDVYVNLDVVSGTEVRDVAPEALGINLVENVHFLLFALARRSKWLNSL